MSDEETKDYIRYLCKREAQKITEKTDVYSELQAKTFLKRVTGQDHSKQTREPLSGFVNSKGELFYISILPDNRNEHSLKNYKYNLFF